MSQHQTAQSSYPNLAIGGPTRWRSVDLITVAIAGVTFGVAFWAWDVALYPGVHALLAGFPPAASATLGVWLLPCVFGALLIRRPGAALLCELVAASVEIFLGNQWGGLIIVSAVLQACGVELVVGALRWQKWNPTVAMTGGLMAATFELVAFEWWIYKAEFSFVWKLTSLGFAAVSGVLIAGLGGWALLGAISATGALDAFPAGRERLVGRN